jgi:DNA-binding beta-propeller fold protein YncE
VFTRGGSTAYVLSWGVVTPIATATNTAGPPIKVAGPAEAIVITPDGKTAYVASSGKQAIRGGKLIISRGTVTPITLATNTPGKPIKVGKEPDAPALVP